MEITWLGQLGLAFSSKNQLLMVDPYLMDTLNHTVGPQFSRLVPPHPGWQTAAPDTILLTHDHGDHLDIPSLQAITGPEKSAEILASTNAFWKLKGQLEGQHNYIMMKPGNEWTSGSFHIRAVSARHSDETGVGYLIKAEGLTVLVSGDGLYFRDIAKEVDEPVDIAFIVMNGKGNNMNCVDAARYARLIGCKAAIPVHWGLFEKFSDDPAIFSAECKKLGIPCYIAQIYETLDPEHLLKEALCEK